MASAAPIARAALSLIALLFAFPRFSSAQASASPSAETVDAAKQTARTAFAAEMKKQDHDCKGVEQQQPLNACMATAAQGTETSLNRFYTALRTTLDTGAADRLREAQKTWLIYRQQTCEAAADRYRGGTIAPFIHSSCQIRVTRERMKTLYELYGVGYDQ